MSDPKSTSADAVIEAFLALPVHDRALVGAMLLRHDGRFNSLRWALNKLSAAHEAENDE
jgi:hypothetical protein